MDAETAQSIIAELRDIGVLISELQPPLTCVHQARHVVERLARVAPAHHAVESLQRVGRALRRWDTLPLEARWAEWPAVVEAVRSTDVGGP